MPEPPAHRGEIRGFERPLAARELNRADERQLRDRQAVGGATRREDAAVEGALWAARNVAPSSSGASFAHASAKTGASFTIGQVMP